MILFQVISDSVALALEAQKLHTTKSTIEFLKMFNRAFDCLNVMRKDDPHPDKRKYTGMHDKRYEVNFDFVILHPFS